MTPKKWPDRSLMDLILWSEPLRELVKLVGYAGIKLDEFQPVGQKLADTIGRERTKAAADLILRIDDKTCPMMVRLKDDMRPLVWPILGADPDLPPWWAKLTKKVPDASASTPPSVATEPKPKPKRKGASAPL